MRILLMIALSIPTIAAAQIGPPPSEDIHWIQTDSDTLSLDPFRVRVEFKIVNEDTQVPVCDFNLTVYPGGTSPPDSCEILECAAPAGWGCFADPQIIAVPNWSITSSDNPQCVLPGETVEGFAFVTAGESCCYLAEANGPVFNVTAIDALCIGDGQAVQAILSSWGRVKTIYR